MKLRENIHTPVLRSRSNGSATIWHPEPRSGYRIQIRIQNPDPDTDPKSGYRIRIRIKIKLILCTNLTFVTYMLKFSK